MEGCEELDTYERAESGGESWGVTAAVLNAAEAEKTETDRDSPMTQLPFENDNNDFPTQDGSEISIELHTDIDPTNLVSEPSNPPPPPFEYKDWDTLENELCELYGEYETEMMTQGSRAFNGVLENRHSCEWQFLTKMDKANFIHDLLDQLEMAEITERAKAIFAIEHVAQGCWSQLTYNTLKEQLQCLEANVEIMLECDAFWKVWGFFQATWKDSFARDRLIDYYEDKYNSTCADACLNILSTCVYVTLIKCEAAETTLVSPIFLELVDGLLDNTGRDGKLVLVTLMNKLIETVQNAPRSTLTKKLLHLIRGTLLCTLGGSEELHKNKDLCRKKAGLKASHEGTVRMCQNIKPLQDSPAWCAIRTKGKLMSWFELNEISDLEEKALTSSRTNTTKLPWRPKSSMSCLSAITERLNPECCNNVYYGEVNLLPTPLKQRINLVIRHLHVPLALFQIQEDKLVSQRAALADQEKPLLPKVEEIFSALFPILEPAVKCLTKVISEVTPRKNIRKNAFIRKSYNFSCLWAEDGRRQQEIIVKAASAILLILLKHTNVNHVYQFECVATEVVGSSFIPTALRYFNRDVQSYLTQRPMPQTKRNPFEIMNVESSAAASSDDSNNKSNAVSQFSTRNMFTCVNLLKILNKITKGKPSRILVMMLRMFKAPDCLKRALAVRDSLFQQYTLKLLKMQCKYLGKEWRRNNQLVLSAIYYKVRHRLLDDWVTGEPSSTETKTWPWECYAEEVQRHDDVLCYLRRKYGEHVETDGIHDGTVNNHLERELSDSFKANYEVWLQREVYQKEIDWDRMLQNPHLV